MALSSLLGARAGRSKKTSRTKADALAENWEMHSHVLSYLKSESPKGEMELAISRETG